MLSEYCSLQTIGRAQNAIQNRHKQKYTQYVLVINWWKLWCFHFGTKKKSLARKIQNLGSQDNVRVIILLLHMLFCFQKYTLITRKSYTYNLSTKYMILILKVHSYLCMSIWFFFFGTSRLFHLKKDTPPWRLFCLQNLDKEWKCEMLPV